MVNRKIAWQHECCPDRPGENPNASVYWDGILPPNSVLRQVLAA